MSASYFEFHWQVSQCYLQDAGFLYQGMATILFCAGAGAIYVYIYIKKKVYLLFMEKCFCDCMREYLFCHFFIQPFVPISFPQILFWTSKCHESSDSSSWKVQYFVPYLVSYIKIQISMHDGLYWRIYYHMSSVVVSAALLTDLTLLCSYLVLLERWIVKPFVKS